MPGNLISYNGSNTWLFAGDGSFTLSGWLAGEAAVARDLIVGSFGETTVTGQGTFTLYTVDGMVVHTVDDALWLCLSSGGKVIHHPAR